MQVFVWVWMYLLFVLEAAAVALLWRCTCRFPAAEMFFGRLARHKAAPLTVGLLAMALRLSSRPALQRGSESFAEPTAQWDRAMTQNC